MKYKVVMVVELDLSHVDEGSLKEVVDTFSNTIKAVAELSSLVENVEVNHEELG